MPETYQDHAQNFLDALSASTREVMNGYARFLAPERLTQPILQGWRIGNTYIVSDDNSHDPSMERRIVAENSYGRQLGRMMDAMEVLIRALPEKEQSESAPFKAFLELAEEIKAIKQKSQSSRFEKLKGGLELLKKECPDDFDRLMREFK